MIQWAKSDNFHLRRLASGGLRPKLPWAAKLDTFIDNPEPIFEILEILKEDEWNESDHKNTKWIIKRATRKIRVD